MNLNKILCISGFVFFGCCGLFAQDIQDSEDFEIQKVEKKLVSEKEKKEIIKLVEDYLNNITDFQCRFEQFTSKNGEVSNGVVYIKRPQVVRVEYEAPNPYTVVIDGKNIVYYDRDLKEESVLSKNVSPFSIFLNKNISLKNFNVSNVLVDHKHIYVDLTPRSDISKGILHLVFDENPIRLHQWRIEISKDDETVVTIQDYENKIDSNLLLEDLKNCKKKLINE